MRSSFTYSRHLLALAISSLSLIAHADDAPKMAQGIQSSGNSSPVH